MPSCPCGTILNSYNPGPLCYVCEPPTENVFEFVPKRLPKPKFCSTCEREHHGERRTCDDCWTWRENFNARALGMDRRKLVGSDG